MHALSGRHATRVLQTRAHTSDHNARAVDARPYIYNVEIVHIRCSPNACTKVGYYWCLAMAPVGNVNNTSVRCDEVFNYALNGLSLLYNWHRYRFVVLPDNWAIHVPHVETKHAKQFLMVSI